jgi:hypothetical protein
VSFALAAKNKIDISVSKEWTMKKSESLAFLAPIEK